METLIHWTVTYFLQSCQRTPAPPFTLSMSSIYFLLVSKTQIATGFLVHCVYSSLFPGQQGEGDKMVIRSPRWGRGTKVKVTVKSMHTLIGKVNTNLRAKNSKTSDFCVILGKSQVL